MVAGALVAGTLTLIRTDTRSGPQLGADLGELRAIAYEYALIVRRDRPSTEREDVVARFTERLEALRPAFRGIVDGDASLDDISVAFGRLTSADDAVGQDEALASTVGAVNSAVDELDRGSLDDAALTRVLILTSLTVLTLVLGYAALHLAYAVRSGRRTEAALRQATDRLQSILDNAQNGITIVDGDGTVQFANPAMSELTGIPLDSLVGASAARYVDPDEITRISEIRLARLQGASAPNRYVRTLARSDGGRVHVDSMASVVDFQGKRMVLVEHRNVSGEVEARQAAERSAARLDTIFDTVPDVIWVAQGDGTITHVNRAVLGLLGHDRSALNGTRIQLLFEEAGASAHLTRYLEQPALIPPDVPEHTVTARATDGMLVPVDLRLSVGVFEGTPYLVGVMHDARPRQRAEADRLLAERAVVRSDFLATMSHELRTPLHAIMGFAEVLEDGAGGTLTERQREYVSHISDASTLLLALVEDVLDVARIDSGKYQLFHQPFSPADALGTAVATIRQRAEAKGLALEVDVRDAPIQWTGDQRAFVQIALNLLSNAVKFTADGGVRVQLSGHAPLVLRVTDTGMGISNEDSTRIFEPFEQVVARSSAQPGTGLGLAIVRRLASLHGGSVTVTSTPGEGSEFTVELVPFVDV